jgi:putative RNA 2'-phosphotransferase
LRSNPLSDTMNDKPLSKFMSLVLRHRAPDFGLSPDAEGFVPLADLLRLVSDRMGATLNDVQRVAEFGDGSKKRFEIRGELIRARYGHSLDLGTPVDYPPVEPPEVLFHGTHPQALARIRTEGLKAMNRQYVHLSTTVARAREVAARRARHPVLLTIHALAAHHAGIVFHAPEPQHYLARAIPVGFIKFPITNNA